MSHHSATVIWNRGDDVFTGGRYSRAHLWQFDGGVSVTASAAPDVVPLPFSRADAVDPEEAFVAALALSGAFTHLVLCPAFQCFFWHSAPQ